MNKYRPKCLCFRVNVCDGVNRLRFVLGDLPGVSVNSGVSAVAHQNKRSTFCIIEWPYQAGNQDEEVSWETNFITHNKTWLITSVICFCFAKICSVKLFIANILGNSPFFFAVLCCDHTKRVANTLMKWIDRSEKFARRWVAKANQLRYLFWRNHIWFIQLRRVGRLHRWSLQGSAISTSNKVKNHWIRYYSKKIKAMFSFLRHMVYNRS